MDKEEVDVVCVYCPDTDKCYYFDPRQVNQSVSLRVRPTANGQRVAVRIAEEYRTVPEGDRDGGQASALMTTAVMSSSGARSPQKRRTSAYSASTTSRAGRPRLARTTASARS